MTCYVLVAHDNPQNDGSGRISLPVVGVFETLQDARQATSHDDNTVFALDREEALELVDDFSHDVKNSMHGMWCNTCSKTVGNYKDDPARVQCPNAPEIAIEQEQKA